MGSQTGGYCCTPERVSGIHLASNKPDTERRAVEQLAKVVLVLAGRLMFAAL